METLNDNFDIQSLLKNNPAQSFNREWAGQEIFYYNPQITFREVPTEISLTIPTLCYNHCSKDCNSKFCWIENWKDDRTYLNLDVIFNLIENNEGITCITIMTSVNFPYLSFLFRNIKQQYPFLKTCLYIGLDWEELLKYCDFHRFSFKNLDYIKIGAFKKEFGPLNNPNTNQRFYEIIHKEDKDIFNDITFKFIEKIL